MASSFVGLWPGDRTGGGDCSTARAPAQLEAAMSRGGPIEAGLRALLYIQAGEGADERQFNAIEALRTRVPEGQRVTLQQLKETVREQAALLRTDPNKAVASIAKLLPEDPEQRARAASTVIHDVAAADGNLTPDQERQVQFGSTGVRTAWREQARPVRTPSNKVA